MKGPTPSSDTCRLIVQCQSDDQGPWWSMNVNQDPKGSVLRAYHMLTSKAVTIHELRRKCHFRSEDPRKNFPPMSFGTVVLRALRQFKEQFARDCCKTGSLPILASGWNPLSSMRLRENFKWFSHAGCILGRFA